MNGRLRSPAVMRVAFAVLGCVFVGLGFIGLFLPVFPTTPFLIVALACFTRSSARLEAWLLAQPHFGPILSDWRERGAVPRAAKWLALISSSAGFVLFLWGTGAGWPLVILVGALIALGMAYVWTRPDA